MPNKHPAMEGVEVDVSDPPFDRYRGSAEALIRAGIVTAEQLVPQGRTNGYLGFYFPDGTPVPARCSVARDEGVKAVWEVGDGRYAVRVCVSEEERLRRCRNAPPEVSDHYSGDGKCWEGNKEQLLALGVPEHWLVSKPGKKWSRSKFHEDGFDIEVHHSGRFDRYKIESSRPDGYKRPEPIEAPEPVAAPPARPGLRLVCVGGRHV